MSHGGILFGNGVVGAKGAAAGSPIHVPTIRSGDTLLAIVRNPNAAGAIAGLDPSAFIVGDGFIQAASLDTTGDNLTIAWA